MTEGTLVEWKKRVGDAVKKGEILAEVDTEKAAIEVESFHTGLLERLLVTPGEKVPVGTVMAIIREEGAQPAAGAETSARPPSPQRVEPVEPVSARPPAPPPIAPAAGQADRLRISPAARKLAADMGVDPARIPGTGPGGVITLDDVRRSAAEAPTPPVAVAGEPADRQARMRQTIAAAMARSKREIPHYYLGTTIDMGRAVEWLTEENSRRPVTERLLYGVLLIKAVALALRQFPELNGFWKGGAVPSPRIHVGVAISLRQGGLIAPAIHDTDTLSLGDLMQKLQDLVKRARAGTLRSSELSDSTITVTSLGEQGVDAVYGVIYPPQAALVGFGTLAQRPWIIDGAVVARPVVTATLSADHRVSDGHRGALFLAAIERLLQEPSTL
jgi:pyruvate dehydrogenase E2 component (dihydrolipoamide acetyltransferase)